MKKQSCSISQLLAWGGGIIIARLLASCINNSPRIHTVKFDFNYANAPQPYTVEIEDGAILEEPEKPTRSRYDFRAWSTDPDTNTPYDFALPVTSDITLYAIWEREYTPTIRHTITFSFNGMADPITRQYDYGTTLSKDDFPSLDDNTAIPETIKSDFIGWGSDITGDGTQIESFPLKEDTTLYAQWDNGFVSDSDGYTVYSVDGLLAWANAAATNTSINCNILADITMPEENKYTWPRIGYPYSNFDEDRFRGTVNGNGHTISNLVVESEDSAGFIGCLDSSGEVKDLILENARITAQEEAGAYAGGIAGCNYGSITGCAVIGSSLNASGSTCFIGGITGINGRNEDKYASIKACYAVDIDISAKAQIDTSLGGIEGGCAILTSIASSYSKDIERIDDNSRLGIAGTLSYHGKFTSCYSDAAGGTDVTVVDGENVTWESIVADINTGLTGYKYVTNSDEATKDKIPLVLKYTSM